MKEEDVSPLAFGEYVQICGKEEKVTASGLM